MDRRAGAAAVYCSAFWVAGALLVAIFCSQLNVEGSPQISPAAPDGINVAAGQAALGAASAPLPIDSPKTVNILPVESAKNASVTTTAAPAKNLSTITQEKELNSTMPWKVEPRLPRDVVPQHYDIMLRPNLTAGSYSGKPPNFHLL